MANILITGCRGGIALDAAQRLVHRGHTVYATVHKTESIDATKAAFSGAGGAIVFKLDILDAQDRQAAADLPIDVLINNAAIGDSGPLADIDIARIRRTFDTNLFATLALTQPIIKRMAHQGGGRVLFIGSIAGHIPMPFLAPYNMTKFALEGLVYALRQEVKPLGINVVMINPGGYHTGFNQKNMASKYAWMDLPHYSQTYLDRIKKEERSLTMAELKSTQSIAKRIAKACEATSPKKRYVAPLWQWLGAPIVRWIK